MRSVFILGLTYLLLTSQSLAALPSDAGSALSFYRNRTSAFPSGQVSRSQLESKLLRTENEIAFLTRWDNKEYFLQSTHLLRDIQVARFADVKKPTPLLSLNRASASIVKTVPAQTYVEILETDDYWAKVQEKKTATVGWIPLHFLKNRHDDLGVYRNIVDTPLRVSANNTASTLVSIPALQRFIPLEVSKTFIKVQYQGKIGFADTTHFVSRADFASLAYHPKKNWVTVLYRNNDNLITQKGEVIPLKEVMGYVTNGLRGIIVKPEYSYGPPLRARVEIVKPEAYSWGVSRIDGHGEVWWKQSNLLTEELPKTKDTLTTDELLKREIYSIAFESKTSVKGLVSSEGVYRTEDGLTWTKIPLFGKQNNPVSIHPNGTWFVGSYRSSNKGTSFEPFIRWDKLAQAIESAYHRNPKILRLTKIESLPNSQVQISVDTGSNKVKLKSIIGDFRWDVIKN